jgi:Rod binding domain-containing protein
MMETDVKPVPQADSSRELESRKRKLLTSCREFESVMTSFMMKTMRDGVSWSDEHDNAKEMYEDMLAQEISKEVARSSSLGIGDMLYSRLEHLLETRPASALSVSTGDLSLNGMKNPAD